MKKRCPSGLKRGRRRDHLGRQASGRRRWRWGRSYPGAVHVRVERICARRSLGIALAVDVIAPPAEQGIEAARHDAARSIAECVAGQHADGPVQTPCGDDDSADGFGVRVQVSHVTVLPACSGISVALVLWRASPGRVRRGLIRRRRIRHGKDRWRDQRTGIAASSSRARAARVCSTRTSYLAATT
jgi:hypothetical protein